MVIGIESIMTKPKALVLFESSGEVRRALKAQGFDAYSCDLLPADDGEVKKHLQRDAIRVLKKNIKVEVIVAHPPCTALSVSGNHVYAEGKPRHSERLAAIAFTQQVWHWSCVRANHVILENPVGVLTTQSSLPTPQYVQPYDFGEDASKKTALFLHNFPKLKPTRRVPGRFVSHEGKVVERWANQTDSGQNKLGPSDDRWKLRSKTYPGIAQAIAKSSREVVDS